MTLSSLLILSGEMCNDLYPECEVTVHGVSHLSPAVSVPAYVSSHMQRIFVPQDQEFNSLSAKEVNICWVVKSEEACGACGPDHCLSPGAPSCITQ